MSATPISLTIGAVDGTKNAFDRANDRVEAFAKQTQSRMNAATAGMRRFGAQTARMADVSGLNRVAAATRGVTRAATDLYGKLGQVVPLVGIIGSAASVAGIARMTSAWAEWGQRIANTSQRIGLAGSHLSALQGAASLAGSSGDAMTAGLQGVGQSLYDAAGGRNAQAMVMSRTLELSANEMKDSQSALFAVANRIQRMRNPFAQAQVMSAFNIPEELLPAMRKGEVGLREYMATARRLNPVTEEMIARAGQLHEAQSRVTQATEGLRNKIADRLEPVLTPLLTHFSDWIAMSPAFAHGTEWLGLKVADLAHWLESGGIERFGSNLQGWVEPIGAVTHALGGADGTLGALELLAGFMVGSFALKIIRPWAILALRIATVTRAVAGFAATMGAFSPPAWLAAIMGASGAAAGKMNVPMVDDMGRPIGNWGGAQGQAAAEMDANKPREPFVPLGTMIWRKLFGGGGGGGAQTVPMKPGQQQDNGRAMGAVFRRYGYSDEFTAAMLGSGI